MLYFSEIEIKFSDGKTITIEKTICEEEDQALDKSTQGRKYEVKFSISGGVSFSLDSSYISQLVDKLASKKFRYFYAPPKIKEEHYEDILADSYDFESDTFIKDKAHEMAIYLSKQPCFYQKTQRLIHVDSDEEALPRRFQDLLDDHEISRLPKDLKDRYLKVQENFAITSQEIDGTFFNRLLENKFEKYSPQEIADKISAIKAKIMNFKKYDLVNEKMGIVDKVPSDKNSISSLYLYDMEKKIATLDNFYNRLWTFDQCVNGKSLSNKTMILNRTVGIRMQNELEETIPLAKLSSGEQNLIILYYQLAFNMEKGSLLLIDEPENSMHVGWAGMMLKDYKSIAKNLGCQVVIATHSPTFINGDWNINVDLTELHYGYKDRVHGDECEK